jgi:hypothetical protein
MTIRLLLTTLLLSCGAPLCAARTAAIVAPDSPAIRFAVGDVTGALAARHYEVVTTGAAALQTSRDQPDLVIHFWPVTNGLGADDLMRGMSPVAAAPGPEGFSLRRVKIRGQLVVYVIHADHAGGLYGGLEIAERIRTDGVEGVTDTDRNPYMPLRGTKFNLPLDLRTPSYSDMGDSAQQNIATIWDFDFWRAYLDQLARDRYNFVSLWNLHPFPSMVKVPQYPDVALDDVWRSSGPFLEDHSTRTIDLLSPEMLNNRQVVRQLTIDQKIDFWRRVMQYAHDRNIAFHIVTWNIYTYGVDGKYGITDALDNPKTADYFRASVREMFRTYPLLAGIGLTAGENMGEVKMYSGGVDSFDAKENWLFATYGQGVLDAARAEPRRRFRLIHRQHESRAQDIVSTFKPVVEQPNVDFVFSFKYAQAHALSSTTQPFHRNYVGTLGPLKTLWTIRNDDALMLRWAAPDFVREFVRNIPREPSAGYYVGSDMWVWGREFLAKTPRSPRQLEIDKHWLHTLLWGRFGYDPLLDNARIASLVGQRFPGVDGAKLLSAWQNASMIYPGVTGFHWADFDFQWYIEACRSRPGPAKTASGFHSVETFITQPVHPASGNMSIPVYVDAWRKGELAKAEGRAPTAVSRSLHTSADAALRSADAMARSRAAKSDAELRDTLDDIRSMALLGKYYAHKIGAATSLAQARASRDTALQKSAIAELELARGFWRRYTALMGARYRNPVWTNRVGHVDWRELNSEVEADIAIASAPLP